jgi:ribosome recycling factor
MPFDQTSLFKTTEEKMKAALKDLENDLSQLRTGRANPAVLDPVRIDSYGQMVPLKSVANISVADAHLIVVTPWDKSQLHAIEKAIAAANLGFQPVSDGTVIRCPIPPLTEDRRKELVKRAQALAEEHRVSIRNIRHKTKEELEKHGKAKSKGHAEMSEDEFRRALDKLQKMTDENVKKVDELLAKKEQEIMKV